MFCKNCGFQLKDTARFCPKCGTANTPPPIPPQPSNFTPQPNNFAPQQNSSFSPNAQSIAVKTKKSPIIVGVGIVILIVIIIAFCIGFTGRGGVSGGSKGGYKKATEAAEAALTAEHTADAATMMKLLPAEGKEYWEDDKNLTEKQLHDYMHRMNSYSRKYDEVSVKVDDNSNPIENSKVTERVNSNYLDKYGITADEVIYYAECGLTLDGEEHDEGNDVYVYKYNGRWYSIYPEYHLIEDTDSE